MKKIITAALATVLLAGCAEKSTQAGFAIVIDQKSYTETQAEIDQYQKVVESRGLKPILVIDRWGVPDSIRQELKTLHNAKKYPIEGCVFIGDIPVARVRDAQFMTSAFKMDQDGRYSLYEYAVTTDRYYDSFDLEWDFLERDTINTDYFYYTLRADCSQELKPSIYSARITPKTNQGGDKYEKLRRYMQRVNEADANNNPIDNIIYFGGHGNISESIVARMDEKIEMYDQLPWLKSQQKNGITYLDFRQDEVVKSRLINEMQQPKIDYALLHHHGSEEEQLLSGAPLSASLPLQMNNARQYTHSQVRSAIKKNRPVADAKASAEKYLKSPVPDQWIKEATDPEVIAQDEATSYAEDLHVAEFKNYHPQARLVSLDACYNGSFYVDDNIQECYLFGEGNGTLAVIANTVNSIQDRWINRYIGLAGLGMRVGYFAVLNNTLESHLFGDPTFAFTPAADCGFDLNDALRGKSADFWKKQLDSQYADVQVLAMYELAQKCQGNYSDIILNKFKSSDKGMVRLAALLELKNYHDDNFVECLSLALNDNSEMPQRFAAILTSESGDERLIEPMAELYCQITLSDRVDFDLTNSFRSFDSLKLEKAIEAYFPQVIGYSNPDSVLQSKKDYIHDRIAYYSLDFEEEVFDSSVSDKNRISTIKGMRNYKVHQYVPRMLEYLSTPDNEKVQLAMWEGLGWYTESYRRPEIAAKAQEIMADERFSEKIRKEATRTYNRLK